MARLFCQAAHQPMLLPTVHKTAFCLALLACVGGMSPPTAYAQQKIDLSISESRAYGIQALKSKRPDVAQAVALGLLQRDPNDVQALLMLSAAQTAQGSSKEGAITGKRALTHAKTPLERFSATRMIAAAKAKSGNYTQAELWLRRALQAAPDERYRATVERDFKLVKRKNPLKLDLMFGVKPSSNINNGTYNDSLWVGDLRFDLPSDVKALSGIEYIAGMRASYRIHQTASNATDIGLLLYSKSYSLSAKSKRESSDVSARDYAFQAAELSARRLNLRNQGRTILSYRTTLGQNWYGGTPLNRYLRFDMSQKHRVSATFSYQIGLSADYQNRIGSDDLDSSTLSASSALHFRIKDSGKLSLSLEGRNVSADNDNAEYAGVKLALGYAFDNPILGTDVTVNLAVENRDFPVSGFASNGRQDNRFSAGLSLLFSQKDLYGFSPTLDFRAAKTQSSIDTFDTESLTVGVGFRSTF